MVKERANGSIAMSRCLFRISTVDLCSLSLNLSTVNLVSRFLVVRTGTRGSCLRWSNVKEDYVDCGAEKW